MWLLTVAIVLATLKTLVHNEMLEMAWVANMSWWWVIGAFGLTAAWWAYADASGLTRRKAMEHIDERKAEHQRKNREALGLKTTKRK